MRTFRTYVVDEAAGVVAGLVSLPDARIVHLIFNCGTRGSKAGKYERPVSFSCRGADQPTSLVECRKILDVTWYPVCHE